MSNKLADFISHSPKSSGLSEKEDIDAVGLSQQKTLYELVRYHHDTENRSWLAKWAASVVSIWLAIVLLILMLNTALFKLDKTIIIALLGTSTLNVLGLTFIVLRGYFPAGESRKSEKADSIKQARAKKLTLDNEIKNE